MYQVIIVIHILLGLSIIGLILMQQGKGADAGATFGGGASGSVFGAQGAASFLSRTTAILAALFFITSLGLAWINGNKTGAAVDFMGTPAVEKETPDSGLPDIDGANIKEKLPNPAPQSKESTTAPVPPPPVAVPPVSVTPSAPVAIPSPIVEPKEAPKAEDAKVDEEHETELKTEEKPKKTAKKK